MTDITRRDKQEALLGLCEQILTAIKPGLRSSARYRDVGTGRREQDRIMGDPVYYLEVLPAPENSSSTAATLEGEAREVAHGFQVSLWLEYEDAEYEDAEYEDADTYGASSQATYDELVEGTSGLLATLRGAPEPATPGHPDVSGWPQGTTLAQPEGVAENIVDLDNAGRLAHLCRFSITLTHPTL